MILRALLILLLSCSAAHALNGRREIVILISDDVSTNGFGTYGETDSVIGTNYATPQLDILATAGQLYLNFTSQPMCSPSRNDLWYGSNPLLHGVGRALSETKRRGVPWAQRESLVSALQAVNAQVIIVGKHHIQDWGDDALLGTAATQAAAMGFDFADVMMLANPSDDYPPTAGSPHADGNHHYYWIEMNPDTGATSINTTYTTDAFNAAAVARLQDNSDMRPMLLVVAYSAPHTPFNPPPLDACGAEDSVSYTDCYGPSITYIDDGIPGITAELDLVNEDTIIYISENGRPNNAGDTEHCDRALSKGHATACGTRVPMVIRGVDVVTTGNVPALINIADLHDTLLEMFGAPQTGQESESFVDCFTNPSTCAPRTISSAIIFDPPGLPVPPEDGQAFSKYEMHFSIENAGGTILYGMNRVYAENDVGDFEDTLLDLGSPSSIDQDKRYGQVPIPSPSVGEQQDALAAMQAEATRLIDSRWAGPSNQMVGVTMVGVETK